MRALQPGRKSPERKIQNDIIDFLRAKIKTDIIDTLRIYQFINRTNDNLDEQIETLQSVKINLKGTDGVEVSFSVITKTGKPVGSLINLEG